MAINYFLAWYNRLLMRKPVNVAFSVLTVSLLCTVLTIRFGRMPDFSQPTLGFTTTGTNIAKRIHAWNQLADPNGSYIQDPNDAGQNDSIRYLLFGTHKMQSARAQSASLGRLFLHDNIAQNYEREDFEDDIIPSERPDELEEAAMQADQPAVAVGDEPSMLTDSDYGHFVYTRRNLSSFWNGTADHRGGWDRFKKYQLPFHNHFCPLITIGPKDTIDNVRIVMKRLEHHKHAHFNLFETNALLDMCKLQHKIEELFTYNQMCVKDRATGKCCLAWSLPNFVAHLNTLRNCSDLQEVHVYNANVLLQRCLPFYRAGLLSANCGQTYCEDVPPECTENNWVYNTMHYLSDNGSLGSSSWRVTVAMSLMPVSRTIASMDLYRELDAIDLQDPLVKVVAADLGDLKDDLFAYLVIPRGTWMIYIWTFLVLMLLVVLFGTLSLMRTLFTFLTVGIVVTISVFIYSFITPREVFPFMNLLVIIGYSVYCTSDVLAFLGLRKWTRLSRQHLQVLGQITETTRQASIWLFVTTATACASFAPLLWSPIRDIRLSGCFAVIVLICHFVVMLTWVPSAMLTTINAKCCCGGIKWVRKLRAYCTESKQSWDNYVYACVDNYIQKPVCVIGMFISIAVIFICILSTLPLSNIWFAPLPNFQMFASDNPIEQYTRQYRNYFAFEVDAVDTDTSGTMPLYFVFGIRPDDQGNLVDANMNAYSPEAQVWLRSFCAEARRQPFGRYETQLAARTANCFVETVAASMRRACMSLSRVLDRTPCCDTYRFPMNESLLRTCLPRVFGSLYRAPDTYFERTSAGPLFEKFMANQSHYGQNEEIPVPKMNAFVLKFESTVNYRASYGEIESMQTDVNEWFAKQLENAPPALRNGWFVSDLMLYDVQSYLHVTLIRNQLISIAVTICLIYGTTRKAGVSTATFMCVAMSDFTIMCILVHFFDWHVYIAETIGLNIAIALITQCTMHFALSYCDAVPDVETTGAERARCAFTNMLAPALWLGLVTVLMNWLLMQSPLLPISQMGTLLVVTVSVGLFYRICFLTCSLFVFGPKINHAIGCLWTCHHRRRQDWIGELQLANVRRGVIIEELPPGVHIGDAAAVIRVPSRGLVIPMRDCRRNERGLRPIAGGHLLQNPLALSDVEHETSFSTAAADQPQRQQNVQVNAVVEVHNTQTPSEDGTSSSLSLSGRHLMAPLISEHSSSRSSLVAAGQDPNAIPAPVEQPSTDLPCDNNDLDSDDLPSLSD